MPSNKNAFLRYQILDELLSNRYHDYSIQDMTDIVSERMAEMDPDTNGIVKRTIEKDIKFLEWDGPFLAEIERYPVTAFSKEKQKEYTKRCLRYADPSYSIFNKEMTDDEKYLLREALSLLGQFDGLPNLDALDRLRRRLCGFKQEQQIISFTKNPLENSSLLGELFTVISQRQVVKLHYHKFGKEDELVVNIHPYLLKEYNRRWYLFGAAETDNALLNFSLDRIDRVVPLSAHKYVPYEGDINELFEDIVGVTYYKDAEVQKIYFWVSDFSKDYVETKPIHESQRSVTGNKEAELRSQYPGLKDGKYFRIDCKENYELIRELCSFGKDLIVVEPSEIREKLKRRICEMNEMYNN